MVRSLTAVVWLLALAGLSAQTANESRAAVAFLTDLQRALARNDRAAVASMVQYPITVLTSGLRIPFTDRASLLERFDDVFAPALKEAIARAKAPAVADTGLSIAGMIWAERSGDRYLITRIGLRLESPTPAASTNSTTAKTTARKGAAPERLVVSGRLRMAQATGTLAAGEVRSYTVWAGQGQMLEARVDGVRGRDVVVRIYHAKTGAGVDARAAAGLRRWAGRVAVGSDYRIDVVRLAPSSEPAPRYLLVVTVQ